VTQTTDVLCNDIIYLSRSLGYNIEKKIPNNLCSYFIYQISGEKLEDIPVLLTPTIHGNANISSRIYITITPIGKNKYNGFELDGNGRFLLGDFTVTHNSSLLGCLVGGKNDDGRGSSRLSVFNFQHEVSSGRTSSIAQHILGFDSHGKITNYCKIGKKSWPDIVKTSSKVISFFDLAGHKKYLKTTILGMTSSSPDVSLIVVGGNMGINNMTREHLFLCLSLAIPFVFVITKIDICKDRQKILKETIQKVNQLIKLPGIRRVPFKINSENDVITAAKNIHSLSIVPIFHISNVTGEGIDNIKQFFNLIKQRPENIKISSTKDVEFHVESTFYVPGVGTVVGGQLLSGSIKTGDKLMLGPNDSKYVQVHVRSIHCKRVLVQEVSSGCYVCLALKKIERKNIRRGNVILSMKSNAIAIQEFTVNVQIMKSHSTTIKIGYEPVVHINNIRQTAKIIEINNKIHARPKKINNEDCILRTGDKATVKFSFTRQPEYIKKGQRILFCEGTTKALGIVL
jgi:GTPase